MIRATDAFPGTLPGSATTPKPKPIGEPGICRDCDEGRKPSVLDEDGTHSYITGRPGTMCHAAEEYWWPCKRFEGWRFAPDAGATEGTTNVG
jgi:hypothetical protein